MKPYQSSLSGLLALRTTNSFSQYQQDFRPPPPIFASTFVSDAAGVPYFNKFSGNEGVGGIGMDYNGELISAYQLFWEEKFVTSQDRKMQTWALKQLA
jgi:hypothetical protein